MGVSIISGPNEVDFCNNPIAFKVQGDNYISSAGTLAQLTFEFTAGDVAGNTFNLAFLDYSLDFVCAATPNDSGLQYPPKGSESLDDYMEIVIGYLQKNYYLEKYFNISFVAASSMIKIEAKEKGSDYSLTVTAGTSHINVINNVAGASDTLASNYRMVAIPYLLIDTSGTTYTRLGEIILEPDEDGYGLLYLSKILKNLFSETGLPTFNTAELELNLEALKQYYLSFAEYYGSTPVVKSLESSDVKYLLNGKLAADKFPSHTFWDSLSSKMMFLSNKPKTRHTRKHTQQFLYFAYYTTTGRTVTLKARLYYKSGSSSSVTIDTLRMEEYEVAAVPCGYLQIGLDSYDEIYKYEIYLMAPTIIPLSDEVISEEITFILDEDTLYERNFFYKNDYGVFETLECSAQEFSFSTEKLLMEKQLGFDYAVPEGDLSSNLLAGYDVMAVTSRNMSREEALNVREMMYNDDVYLVGREKYIPVVVVSDRINLVDEMNDVYSISFEYRYKYRDNSVAEVEGELETGDIGSYDVDYDVDYD
jgi:hypothetical protein